MAHSTTSTPARKAETGGIPISRCSMDRAMPTRQPTSKLAEVLVTRARHLRSRMPGNRQVRFWIRAGWGDPPRLGSARGLVTVLWAGNGPRLPGAGYLWVVAR